MGLSPEEYGACWSGAVRIAAGVVLVLLIARFVEPLLSHPAIGAQILGWFLLSSAVLVGAFLGTIGLSHVLQTRTVRR